ncbi:hypothetical protein GIB67_035130 [Kingdonia uniflora]|uniref:Di19 C-terminal domain-containing protein n=1 Tax=Kingdonia uniflora TaxID=39325 RepID=A0A7J7NVQ3_9MAGN|nr:hypothetical protein GIB67_035130 [Kingdonia uniflora]
MQRKRRSHKGGSHSTLALLKKELRGGNLQSLLGGSSRSHSSANTEADPLLSSFMYNLPMFDEPAAVQPHSLVEPSSALKNLDVHALERYDFVIFCICFSDDVLV